jgi:hypothetical protein
MVQTECALERFLLDNPPNEKNVEKASQELTEVQQDLLKIMSSNPKVNIGEIIICTFWLSMSVAWLVIISYDSQSNCASLNYNTAMINIAQ